MSLCFCLYLLCIFITLVTSNSVTDRIDFERDCNVQLNIYDSTVAQVFAYPILGGVVTDPISRCEAKFVAPSNRKIRIYIDEFTLGGGACGHKLKIYDGPLQNDPKWELGCNTVNQNLYTSSRNEVIIAFTKPSADSSQLYKFSLRITTDQGETNLYFKPIKKPDFSIVQLFKALKMPAYQILQHRQRRDTVNQPSYTAPMTGGTGGGDGGGISSGAIAGIAVGCVVGAVIIIAICIYALWRFMRQSEEKKRYGAQEPPPVFVTSSSSTVNGILKHPGSAGSVRSKSTKSRGVDNDAFSDISDARQNNGRVSNDYSRYEDRGSRSRRSGERLKNDYGHQNQGYYGDEESNDYDRRRSYKMANEERGHISLADLSKQGGSTGNGEYPLGRRRNPDESKTESSFYTETETSRTYSESSGDGSNSVSMNPGGRFRKNDREGSVRRSRSRSQSMTSSKSGNSKRPRSSSADRAEDASRASSSQGSQNRHHHNQHQHHHHHHRSSSRSSRRKQQKPPDPYLPIFGETKKNAKKHKH